MKSYKLTDSNGQTKYGTQWGEGVSHSAKGDGSKLCSDGWIHFYQDPILAILMNPIHVNFKDPILWEGEASGEELHEPLKSGAKTYKTLRKIPVPQITKEQRIAFGILCAKKVCTEPEWNSWADKWLSGEDRSEISAHAAAAASASASASASAATYASAAAAYAAHAAAYAANSSINFIELSHKAMSY